MVSMKVYAIFSDAGSAMGFYPDFAFPDQVDDEGVVTGRNARVPEDAVEITEEEWRALASNPGAWRRVDGKVVAYTPPPFIPTQVSRAQGKIMLKRAGLWSRVLDLVAQDATSEIDVWLNDAVFWSRSSPYIAQMAAALSLQSEQVDQLFIEAAKITSE